MFLFPCNRTPQKENQSLAVNTENKRIYTFISDDVVGEEMGGAYLSLIAKRLKLDYSDPNHSWTMSS
jgi:hypothetical protein